MSRFADRERTERYTFPGPCVCVGTPHESDWLDCRVELGAADVAMLASLDGPAAGVMRLIVLIKGWNLTGPHGEEMEVTPDNIRSLYADVASDEFERWVDQHVRMESALPNASGGRSPSGSSATASRTRASRARPSSTTS